MAAASQNELFDVLFNRLKRTSTEDERNAAAADLKNFCVEEYSGEERSKLLWSQIVHQVVSLPSDQTREEKLAILAALIELFDCPQLPVSSPNLFRIHGVFFRKQSEEWFSRKDFDVTTAACRLTGRIARRHQRSAEIITLVQTEITKITDTLKGDMIGTGGADVSRYLILARELAHEVPILVQPYVPRLLQYIWPSLRDSRLVLRERAALLVAQCFQALDNGLTATWHSRQRLETFERMLVEAKAGFAPTSPTEAVHGSMLVCQALFDYGDMFMTSHYFSICDTILKFKESKESIVRKTVITLIPHMAAYDPISFCQDEGSPTGTSFLTTSMRHLLSQLKRPDKALAFISIGHVADKVRTEMRPFLDAILTAIKEGLAMRGKKNAPPEDPIYQCIGMLAKAFGVILTKHMHDLLDLMFASGLGEPLRQALDITADSIKPLQRTIQDRLLDMLSMILSGKPYRPLGAPSKRGDNLVGVARDLGFGQVSGTGHSQETISLALRTLSSFDFGGHVLNEFVRSCALPYLEVDNPDIRQAAALTCCRLFSRDPICYQTSAHSIEVISEVLEKLLTVGIADPEARIRQTVLEELTDKFDRHLAQAENVRLLFIALNDVVFTNRELAIRIIGRLALHNPAYVMPSLRKVLIQMISNLEFSTRSRQMEETTKLLREMIKGSSGLVVNYTEELLDVLLVTANKPDTAPAVASEVISCLGELARVAGESIGPRVRKIMDLVIETLQDQSPTVKREAALKTLGQVASFTGTLIDPYVDYPVLLAILNRLVQVETSPNVRKETIRVIGILGALDPYRRKVLFEQVDESANENARSTQTDISLLMNVAGGQSTEEYFQAVAFNSLVNIVLDPALSPLHYTKAMDAIVLIFLTQGLKCVTFLPQVIPAMLSAIRRSSPSFQGPWLTKLGTLISLVKQHIRGFMDPILSLVIEYWENPSLQTVVIQLVEVTARALEGEFKAFLPRLLKEILGTFDGDLSDPRRHGVLVEILHALAAFGLSLEEYIHLVLPAVLKLFDRIEVGPKVREAAIVTIGTLARRVNFAEHASQIIHSLARVVGSVSPNAPPTTQSQQAQHLATVAMNALCHLVVQLGPDYAIFIPMMSKVLTTSGIRHANYEQLVVKILKRERLPNDFGHLDAGASDTAKIATPGNAAVNQQALKQVWDTSLVSTPDEWREWSKQLGLELLRFSPSIALRACQDLAQEHEALNKELFNVAFISCWTTLYESYQEDFVNSISTAIESSTCPAETINLLLNACEYAEHDDKVLPLDPKMLGRNAVKHRAFAKALHYKELEWFTDPSADVVKALINVNSKLQQQDTAWGILTFARLEETQQDHALFEYEGWFLELNRWQEAYQAFEKRSNEGDEDADVIFGKMRCLHALGEWDKLSDYVQSKWATVSPADHRQMASLAAAAAWALKQWDLMEDYVAVMKKETADYYFYRSVISIHSNQFTKSMKYINKARESVDPELCSLFSESYSRAYNVLIRIQMLSEMEEIITYKSLADRPDRQATMRKTWMKRLKNCEQDVEIWQRVLSVRSLVLTPSQDKEMWIKFANLCRKSDRLGLAEKTLNSLLGPLEMGTADGAFQAPPHVVYAYFKYTWAQGGDDVKKDTLVWLRSFTVKLTADLGLALPELAFPPEAGNDLTQLLARCYLKEGEWDVALRPDWAANDTSDVLTSYQRATHLDPQWYKAWHTWALANFEVIQHLESQQDLVYADVFSTYVVPAVNGFFRSIALSKGNSLQDTLRLLTLWFKHGYHEAVNGAISKGAASVSIDVWLEVIPQIIARIHISNPLVRAAIEQLLNSVGRAHPQALIYPLLVASKSQVPMRKEIAHAIMTRMKDHSAVMVDQASLVSHELIRVAILWHELWTEGLEEASRFYFAEHDPEGMFGVLEPLHDMIEQGAETLREQSFIQSFAHDLSIAREHCRRFRAHGDPNDLSQAWDGYYMVFKKLTKQLQQLPALELQYVSPKLLQVHDLELAVPGTYRSGKPIIRILSFVPTFSVISSKQRPRRLTTKGGDGKDYQFVLKGHEDLRQDERVMQLFGLVNTLLSHDPESFKRHLHIQSYSITPLSPNSGLIGWVQDTDTMHVLIRDYRESRKILLNIEHRLILQMAPDYDFLTLMQKVEVFEYALENTTGQDLYRVLWLKSRNSESWVDRRTTYIRSLASTSMVGYILGLGDRHPSNLLLDRVTGKIVHIDFGDCFEITMYRDKFPEKIPFRLTRMLTNAMEICGVHGAYSKSCEIVMRVMRENKESLMAVLEAFVYDPLFAWKLVATAATEAPVAAEELNQDRGAFGGGNRRRAEENEIMQNANGREVQNEHAIKVIQRIQDKLTGQDFKATVVLPVNEQVHRLIQQATSMENLCQCFIGWCAFW